MTAEGRRRWIDAIVLAIVALAIRLIWFTGPKLVDDVIYSEAAVELSREGWPREDSIFSLRIGFVAARALAVALFGTSPFPLALPSLIASLAQVVLAYLLGDRLFARRIGLAAGVFLAVNPADVFFATEGHTDLCLAALTSGAFLLIRNREGWTPWHRCLMAGLLLGAGHLFKEMAVLPALVLAGVLAVAERSWRRAGALLAGYGIVPFLEGLSYLVARGDFLHRFALVRAGQREALFSPVYVETVPTVRRILLDFPNILFNPAQVNAAFAGLLGWWMAASALFLLIARRREAYPFLAWIFGLLLLINFWPISLIPYRPAMVAYPWLLVHLSLPIAIGSGLAWSRLLDRSRPLAGCLATATALISLVCISVLHSDVSVHQEPLRAVLDRLPAKSIIVTDLRSRSLMRVYRGFPEDGSIRTWSDPRPAGEWYYVENPIWVNLLSSRYGQLPPQDLLQAAASRETLFTAAGTDRLRWRALVRGKIERTTGPVIRVYRMHGP